MNKNVVSFLILILAVVIFGLLIYYGGDQTKKPISAPKTSYDMTVNKEDNVKGNRNANVVLIEYSDFQCPACGLYYPILKKLSAEYSDNVAFVYRHYPIRTTHKNAQLAAQAAEAAGAQGKFWEMHNILFEKQPQWADLQNPKDNFLNYAGSLKLDQKKFLADLNSAKIKQKINEQMAAADKAGLAGTPTIFLNGRFIENRGYKDLKNKIEQLLK